MKKLIILIAIVGASVSVAQVTGGFPDTALTLKVLDESEKPILGAQASITFSVNDYGRSKYETKQATTSSSGVFSAIGKSDGDVSYSVRKGGWYLSHSRYPFSLGNIRNGKQQPWNPEVNVVLKPIVNPIPMYARKLQTQIPQATGPVGFDLETGDWVAPYGKGGTNDILFTLKRQFTDRRNYEASVAITFPNKGDGVQAISPKEVDSSSELKLPRTAPEAGYEPKHATSIGATAGGPVHDDAQTNRSYFFRVRTVLDEDGKVKSALYGKIDGDFRLDAINSKTCFVLFTYYLNPTPNDRNMEFNPENNLSANLTSDERVSAP